MTRTAYLALDLGAGSGRAILGVLDHERLDLVELHRFDNEPLCLPPGLHWDLPNLLRQVLEGTRRAVKWTRSHKTPLVSLGVDTWGVDFGLLGRSGVLLGLPSCYRDERHARAFEPVLATLGRDWLYARTGVQFMPLNTLYQLAALAEAEPGLVDAADRLLFMPDLLHFLLTGKKVVEATIASTSQMVDPSTGDWAADVLDRLGLPAHMLGPIVPAGTVVGPLRPELRDALGADASFRVVTPASHDTASAVAAVPADAATKWCYLSSGTWSLMGIERTTPIVTPAARDAPFTNEGGLGGTIRFLKNITGLWIIQACRRAFEQRGGRYAHADLARMALDAEPFRTLIRPELAAFAAPGDMPAKIAAFARRTRQPEPETPGQFVRCSLESLALTYRHTLAQLEQVLGERREVIHIVGGGGRNDLLNQMTADATGRRVVVGPYEATAAGSVLVQAMAHGVVRDAVHLRAIVGNAATVKIVQPRDTGTWEAPYARFLDLPCEQAELRP